MEQKGKLVSAGEGFNEEDLKAAKAKFEAEGFECVLLCLNEMYGEYKFEDGKEPENAFVLVVRKDLRVFWEKEEQMD